MKFIDCKNEPIKVFGIPLLYSQGEYRRLPETVMNEVPSMKEIGLRPNGARICFKTNSSTFTLRTKINVAVNSEAHSLLDMTGFIVYIGERQTSRYAGALHMMTNDGNYQTIEKSFGKSSDYEDVTIFMPGISFVEFCEVGISEIAEIKPPTPYTHPKPIVVYGSSITGGGATSRVSNNYISLLSRWLDSDYHNYGFAGRAKGEPAMARYFASLDMGVFILDYDHNADNTQFLQETHEPFFKILREAKPELPIVMLSSPNLGYPSNLYSDFKFLATLPETREVIRQTYENAKKAGDNNVYFIDGETLFGKEERHACTIDTLHPNDFGFMNMAKTIYPVIKNILEG